MQNRDEEFMRLALELASQLLENDEMPVGAVVTNGDKIMGKSLFSSFVSPYFGHAEMVALNHLHGRFERGKITVYTTMEPCVMCMGAILHFPVSRVVYALEDPHGGASARLDLWVPPRHQGRVPEIVPGVLREESRSLLRRWFQTTKNPYWSSDVGKTTPLYKLCTE